MKAGGEENEGIRWLDGITDSMEISLGKLWEMVKGREAWQATVHGVMLAMTEQLNNNNKRDQTDQISGDF